MKTDFLGNVKSKTLIKGIKASKPIIFNRNDTDDILIGVHRKENNALSVGIGVITLSFGNSNLRAKEGIMALKIDKQNQPILLGEITQVSATTSKDFQLIDLDLSNGGSNFSVLLHEKQQVALNNTSLPYQRSISNGNVVLISSNKDTGVNFIKSLSSQNLDLEKAGITYGDADQFRSLMVGFTFSQSINFNGSLFGSNGGKDILLLKISELGGTEWSHQYGTEADETVSQLLYNSNILYFGGELIGNKKERLIGNYFFIDNTNTNSKAYISYVFDQESGLTAAVKPLSQDSLNIIPFKDDRPLSEIKDLDNQFSVYPNPFTNQLFLNVEDISEFHSFEITDIIGRKIHTILTNPGQTNYEVNLNNQNNSIYIIKAYGTDGRVLGIKKAMQVR